jgi:hypothetical protein
MGDARGWSTVPKIAVVQALNHVKELMGPSLLFMTPTCCLLGFGWLAPAKGTQWHSRTHVASRT